MAKYRKGSAAAKAHMAYVSSFRKKGGGKGKKGKAKSNFYSAGMIANSPKKKAKRNPDGGTMVIGGVRFPALETVGGALGGLVLPPVFQGLGNRFLPASLTQSSIGALAVRAGSVMLPAWLIKRFLSVKAGNLVMAVGFAVIAAERLQPMISSAVSGMSGQPFLGQYLGAYGGNRLLPDNVAAMRRGVPMMESRMSVGVPGRLQAGSRFN